MKPVMRGKLCLINLQMDEAFWDAKQRKQDDEFGLTNSSSTGTRDAATVSTGLLISPQNLVERNIVQQGRSRRKWTVSTALARQVSIPSCVETIVWFVSNIL
jgi:hypothetical protein